MGRKHSDPQSDAYKELDDLGSDLFSWTHSWFEAVNWTVGCILKGACAGMLIPCIHEVNL